MNTLLESAAVTVFALVLFTAAIAVVLWLIIRICDLCKELSRRARENIQARVKARTKAAKNKVKNNPPSDYNFAD